MCCTKRRKCGERRLSHCKHGIMHIQMQRLLPHADCAAVASYAGHRAGARSHHRDMRCCMTATATTHFQYLCVSDACAAARRCFVAFRRAGACGSAVALTLPTAGASSHRALGWPRLHIACRQACNPASFGHTVRVHASSRAAVCSCVQLGVIDPAALAQSASPGGGTAFFASSESASA